MDDSFKDLEAELKGLRLRQPSAQLFARLERDLAEEIPEVVAPPPRPRYASATNLSSWKWSGWRMAGMAAALTLVATVGVVILKQSETISPGVAPELASNDAPREAQSYRPVARDSNAYVNDITSRYQPVAATNVLYDVKDEGYANRTDDADARRVRARYIDTYTFENPRNNSSLKWSVPRDEVRVIRASWN
ncbi:hypothetical protein [Oleiharenicola lentus]|uniref:hypothetical protein n=1 Tax=Oleiharenicola lentus TaxID=2508720 RepID=UPI003F67CBF4